MHISVYFVFCCPLWQSNKESQVHFFSLTFIVKVRHTQSENATWSSRDVKVHVSSLLFHLVQQNLILCHYVYSNSLHRVRFCLPHLYLYFCTETPGLGLQVARFLTNVLVGLWFQWWKRRWMSLLSFLHYSVLFTSLQLKEVLEINKVLQYLRWPVRLWFPVHSYFCVNVRLVMKCRV